MKWYSRSMLDRFISNQSNYDENTAKSLDLRLGRTSKSRSIVVTASVDPKNNKLLTSMDIMQGVNEVQSGSKEAQNAYNIGLGIFLSQLEGRVLGIDPKIDLFQIWGNAPKDRIFMLVTSDDKRQKVLENMKDSGCPEILLENLRESEKMFIIPDKPTEIAGEKHWAWLEIDPDTYETISVLDTGEHGGMAEYVVNLMPSLDDTQKYIVGGFVGITTSI